MFQKNLLMLKKTNLFMFRKGGLFAVQKNAAPQLASHCTAKNVQKANFEGKIF